MAVLMVAVALPRQSQAAECNIFAGLTYTKAHTYLIPPEEVTVNAQIFTGSITTDTSVGPFADIERVRFMLECDGISGIGCADTGAEVSYSGPAILTGAALDATCIDVGGVQLDAQVTVTGNEVVIAFGHFNASVFTPASLHLDPTDSVGCSVHFPISVNAHDIGDATPNVIEQDLGYSQPDGDAFCNDDPATLSSGSSQTGTLLLCPLCTSDACTTITCNQSAGTCSISTPTAAVAACTAQDNACQTVTCNTTTGSNPCNSANTPAVAAWTV